MRRFVIGMRKDGEELGEWVRRGARGLVGVVKESGRGFVFVAIGVGGLIVQAVSLRAIMRGEDADWCRRLLMSRERGSIGRRW